MSSDKVKVLIEENGNAIKAIDKAELFPIDNPIQIKYTLLKWEVDISKKVSGKGIASFISTI